MFFRLLVGRYQDSNEINYAVKINRDKIGKVISIEQPIIESEIELDKKFMAGKFERITAEEQSSLLNSGAANKVKSEIPAPIIITEKNEIDSELSRKEDVAPQHQCGDVTDQFPKARPKSLLIYRQIDGSYYISSQFTNELIADGIQSRIKVNSFIKQYKKAK